MSILIKGMEIPTSCYLCPCNKDDGFGFFTCGVTHSECDFIRFPTDCPLIPVPPHGDLMDRDDFFATCPELVDGYKRISDDLVVIPAEEGE